MYVHHCCVCACVCSCVCVCVSWHVLTFLTCVCVMTYRDICVCVSWLDICVCVSPWHLCVCVMTYLDISLRFKGQKYACDMTDTYTCDMTHSYHNTPACIMSHGAYMSESRHTYGWVKTYIYVWYDSFTRQFSWMNVMNGSSCTCERVMAHRWVSRNIHISVIWLIRMTNFLDVCDVWVIVHIQASLGTQIGESRHTYKCDMTHYYDESPWVCDTHTNTHTHTHTHAHTRTHTHTHTHTHPWRFIVVMSHVTLIHI